MDVKKIIVKCWLLTILLSYHNMGVGAQYTKSILCGLEILNITAVSEIEVYLFSLVGQFGVIRRAKLSLNQESRDHTEVAIKLIKNQTPEDIKCFLREAYIMSQFDHVNVLNLTGIIWEHNEPPAVVTPYMGKGSLLDLVRKSDMVGSLSLLTN